MNYKQVINYLGWFILYYSLVFLVLLIPAFIYKEYNLIPAIFETFFCTLLLGSVGIILTYKKNPEEEENFLIRESLAFVGLGWIIITILGALPFYLSENLSLVDAIFESISGYTTTGATIVHDIEAFPKTLLFWRAFTHFLGGVGIVVIFVSILPYIGAGGRLLLESESFAPDIRSVKPRIKESVKQILLVYLTFNAANIVLLMIFGMNFFDAVCHAFSTLATGGFSTRQMSIGAYNSLPIEIITIFFMFCGATNFGLLYQIYHGNFKVFIKNVEWKVYVLIWFSSIVLIAFSLIGFHGTFSQDPTHFPDYSLGKAFRDSAFTVTSLMSCTGFVTADFDTWPHFAKCLLLAIIFIGGCAGSTAGGIKTIRFTIICKLLFNRITSIFQPRTIKTIRVGEQVISEETQKAVTVFVVLWIFIIAIGSLVMSWTGLPLVSAISSVIVCFSNCGPGLEYVGGYEDYSFLSPLGKSVLSFIMLTGRVELYSILALFLPSFWRGK